MRTKQVICKGQVRTIEDAVDSWKADHECAMKVRDIEDIIPVGLFIRDQFRTWIADLWESARIGQMANPCSEGEAILHWLGEAQKAMGLVSTYIANMESLHYSEDNADAFAGAVNDVRRMEQDFRSSWLMPDARQIAQARQELASGQFQSAEDVLREVQGTRPH